MTRRRQSQTSSYEACWAFRHPMDVADEPDDWPMPASELWEGARYILHLRCTRCGTRRAVALDWRCKILRSIYYDRPDNYLAERGDRSRTPQRARQALVKGTR